MEMERYGLEPISARYPISTLSPYIDTLVNKIRLAQKMTKKHQMARMQKFRFATFV